MEWWHWVLIGIAAAIIVLGVLLYHYRLNLKELGRLIIGRPEEARKSQARGDREEKDWRQKLELKASFQREVRFQKGINELEPEIERLKTGVNKWLNEKRPFLLSKFPVLPEEAKPEEAKPEEAGKK